MSSPGIGSQDAAHMGSMHPYRILTNREQLDSLAINSIICPRNLPAQAQRKAGKDTWYCFIGGGSITDDEVWSWMTTHCPDKTEVWVLWDAAAKPPTIPSAWQTIIPGRSPVKKAHTSLGAAKNAIRAQMYSDIAHRHMQLLQLDPGTGEFAILHDIQSGTHVSALPWSSKAAR